MSDVSCNNECDGAEATDNVNNVESLCDYQPGSMFTVTSVDDGDLQVTVTINSNNYDQDAGDQDIIGLLWDFDYDVSPDYDTTYSWTEEENDTIAFGDDCPESDPVCGPNQNNQHNLNLQLLLKY